MYCWVLPGFHCSQEKRHAPQCCGLGTRGSPSETCHRRSDAAGRCGSAAQWSCHRSCTPDTCSATSLALSRVRHTHGLTWEPRLRLAELAPAPRSADWTGKVGTGVRTGPCIRLSASTWLALRPSPDVYLMPQCGRLESCTDRLWLLCMGWDRWRRPRWRGTRAGRRCWIRTDPPGSCCMRRLCTGSRCTGPRLRSRAGTLRRAGRGRVRVRFRVCCKVRVRVDGILLTE